MATISRDFVVRAPAEAVSDAVRDVGAVHTRLARGFVTGTTYDGESRTVTFENGFVVRELIVDIDDARRRLAYAAVGGRSAHHNASIEIRVRDDGTCLFVWTTDVLPHDLRDFIAGQMDRGVEVMKATLGGLLASA
jgi:hypothetical protein